ncbi:hypothetical protein [Alloyangia pacifica]|uniref:hypothetical protein n=1 Tax=Alloyangia pacifica TaxID=311180 RepID=UPI0031E1D663
MEQAFEFVVSAGRLLPVTVVVAISLFVVKEVLEGKRRRQGNSRKRRAVCRLLANEIERNHWSIKSLRESLGSVERALGSPNEEFTVITDTLGGRLVRGTDDGEMTFERPIPTAHLEGLASNLMLLAELDETLFEQALITGDALKELEHVINLLIDYGSDDSKRWMLDTYPDYARSELAEIEGTISNFYVKLTGQSLKAHRLR